MFETGRCRVHVPEGATPKDGLSAGRRHGYPDRLRDGRHSGAPRDLAMTGKITLRGRV
jgi:ATP-dependent Lon protease